ncbi:PCNA-associated factor isoform X2 [Dromaius novaehollandiae]|uniref:PCNA-associated factor isoform X2 n=1 Tax=Dromaius novaehollandiae TaxID=8790 RepID=UPI00311D992A
MVRTKADGGGGGTYRKVVAARAPRKVLGSSSANAGPSSSPQPLARRAEGRYAGGNPVCVRPTPAWQRGIGEFLRRPQKENQAPGGEAAGSSGAARPAARPELS